MNNENFPVQTSVILLAGGIGSRMKTTLPKQFLSLIGKPIALYSFDLFRSLSEVTEIVVVCDPQYQNLFTIDSPAQRPLRVAFALPGNRRQDSVFNGLQELQEVENLICIHDSARPFIDAPMVRRTIQAANEYGAATTGMPMKFTVKESTDEDFVKRTIPRTHIWEIQTPQVLKPELVKAGFRKANTEHLTVTDDVSLAELIGHPVKLVEGAYGNLKITTSEDLLVAEQIMVNTQEKEIQPEVERV